MVIHVELQLGKPGAGVRNDRHLKLNYGDFCKNGSRPTASAANDKNLVYVRRRIRLVWCSLYLIRTLAMAKKKKKAKKKSAPEQTPFYVQVLAICGLGGCGWLTPPSVVSADVHDSGSTNLESSA